MQVALGDRGPPHFFFLALIWINSGSEHVATMRRNGDKVMPMETAVSLFAIAIPFAIFAAVLAWVNNRTA